MKVLGLRLNAKKSVLSPAQRTTCLGVVWDSTTMQAHMSPARFESILTAVARGREGQSLTVKQFQTVGSNGSCVQRDTSWSAVHETPRVMAQDQGVFPEGKPTSHDQGHAAVPTCLRHVETTLVLVSGPGAGSSLSPRNASDGCVPHRLWSGHEWPLCPRSVEWLPSHVAYQLSGDVGRVSSTETLPPRPKRLPCVGAHRQHSGDLLHQPPRMSAFTPPVQAGTPDSWVVQDKLLSLRAVHIPGHLNMGSLCSREFWRECARTRSVYKVFHLGTWLWCSKLSVGLPLSLLRRFLIAISLWRSLSFCLLLSRPSVGGLWMLSTLPMSPLSSPRQLGVRAH